MIYDREFSETANDAEITKSSVGDSQPRGPVCSMATNPTPYEGKLEIFITKSGANSIQCSSFH